MKCNYYWGSHGCSLPAGDHTVHLCMDVVEGVCCKYDEKRPATARVLFETDGSGDGWRAYSEGFRLT